MASPQDLLYKIHQGVSNLEQRIGEISVEIYNLNEKFEYLDGFLRRIELDKLLKEKEKTNGN